MIFVSLFSFHETFGPLILRRRAASLRKQTGNQGYYTENEQRERNKSAHSILGQTMTRPARLLIFHPLIQISSILSGFQYGILYVVLSTFSDIWTQKYGQSVEISGLHYLTISFGEVVGSQIGGAVLDHFYNRDQVESPAPEFRIPYMYPGVFIAWPMLLAYGWLAQYSVHWFAVDVFVFLTLAGMQALGMPCKLILGISFPLDLFSTESSSETSICIHH